MTTDSRLGTVLVTAPTVARGHKCELFGNYGGSSERLHMLPVPFISSTLPGLAPRNSPRSPLVYARCRASGLSIAPHPPVTRDARIDEITLFQAWFQ